MPSGKIPQQKVNGKLISDIWNMIMEPMEIVLPQKDSYFPFLITRNTDNESEVMTSKASWTQIFMMEECRDGNVAGGSDCGQEGKAWLLY